MSRNSGDDKRTHYFVKKKLSEKISEMNETLPRSGQVCDESIAFTTALSSMCCVSTSVPMISRTKTAVQGRRMGLEHLNINKSHSKLTFTVHLWCFSGL